jgi:hypothetical protein
MAALRKVVNNRATVIFLVAFLIVVHLLFVHGHDDPSALEACVVLFVSLAVGLVAGVLPTSRRVTRSIPVAARVVNQPWEVRRPLPGLLGTVMRH